MDLAYSWPNSCSLGGYGCRRRWKQKETKDALQIPVTVKRWSDVVPVLHPFKATNWWTGLSQGASLQRKHESYKWLTSGMKLGYDSEMLQLGEYSRLQIGTRWAQLHLPFKLVSSSIPRDTTSTSSRRQKNTTWAVKRPDFPGATA